MQHAAVVALVQGLAMAWSWLATTSAVQRLTTAACAVFNAQGYCWSRAVSQLDSQLHQGLISGSGGV